jgi:hypothetical protein
MLFSPAIQDVIVREMRTIMDTTGTIAQRILGGIIRRWRMDT